MRASTASTPRISGSATRAFLAKTKPEFTGALALTTGAAHEAHVAGSRQGRPRHARPLRPARRGVLGRQRRDHDVRQNVEDAARAHRRHAAVHDPRFRLRAGGATSRLSPRSAMSRSASKASARFRGDGARVERLRRVVPGFSCGSTCRPAHFDGVFRECVAVPRGRRRKLPRVLRELRTGAEARAACCSARTRAGRNEEGWKSRPLRPRITTSRRGGCTWWRRASRNSRTTTARRGLPQEQQPWLASAWRRV